MYKCIKIQYNTFQFVRVKDICPFPGAGQNRPLPFLLSRHVSDWGWSPQLWSLPNMEKWKNSSCGEGCHTQAYNVFWCYFWDWTSFNNSCMQTHSHCAKFCAGWAFAKTWKLCHRHYWGAPSLSLVLCPPQTDPIEQQHYFPHKPALDTCRSRCQQMITPLHVLILVLKVM